MKRRHRSEYPPDRQEVGDLFGLWDADGYLVADPMRPLVVPERDESRTAPQDSNHGPACNCEGCNRQDFP